MKNKDNRAVFILSYGRADKVYTHDTLRKYGYTGRIIIVCSDDDKSLSSYKKNFEEVVVFKKDEELKNFDIGDNFAGRDVVVFARNALWRIANKLGVKEFIELDDDYTSIEYRYEEGTKLKITNLNLDKVFDAYFNALNTTKADCIAFAQGGDFIGGKNAGLFKSVWSRKIMNAYFMNAEKPFKFYGRINEDTTTYALLNQTGSLFFTPRFISVCQKQTQANSGGLTEFYLTHGTYVKSFYSVIFAPSAVKVSTMGDTHVRIHHHVLWNHCAPKILQEKYKK